MPDKNKPKQTDRSFAHNWFDSMDSILQLLISDAIWRRQDVNPNDTIHLSKDVRQPQAGLFQTVWYLNDEPVMMLSKSLGENPDIPIHYTICI